MNITKFTKSELIATAIIFAVLFIISYPNFILSLRRARDQVRRDDLGALQHSLGEYESDFGIFPPASSDGKIMDCKKPEDVVKIDKKGRLIVNLIPCQWGQDPFVDLTPGSSKTYMKTLPRDPYFDKGVTYLYFTDGSRFQILAYMEGAKDEVDYDQRVVARNIKCGTQICNVGRAFNCPIDKSIEEYDRELLLK